MTDSFAIYNYKYVDYSDIRLYPQNKYMVITKKNDEPYLIKGPQCVLSKKYSLHNHSRFRVSLTFSMRNPNFLDMLKKIEDTLASLIIQDPSHFFSENEKIEDFDSIVRESFIDFYKINTSKRSIILSVLCNNDINAIVDPNDTLTAETDSGDAVPLESIDDTTIFYPILHLAGISIKREEQLHIQFSLSKIIVKDASKLNVVRNPVSDSNVSIEVDDSTKQELFSSSATEDPSSFKHVLNKSQIENQESNHHSLDQDEKDGIEKESRTTIEMEDEGTDENHDKTGNSVNSDIQHKRLVSESSNASHTDKNKEISRATGGTKENSLEDINMSENDVDYEEVDLNHGMESSESNIEHASFSVKQPEHLYHLQVSNFKRILSDKRHDYMKEWLRKNNIYGANILLDEEEFDYDSDEDSYTST